VVAIHRGRADVKDSRRRVTFVLPERNRSGGVRVTAEMGNALARRGHRVRIAHRLGGSITRQLVVRAKELRLKLRSGDGGDWIAHYDGELVSWRRDLADVGFEVGEIVIAVGSLTVPDVAELDADVVKVRYCHGFTRNRQDLTDAAWSFPMPTIAVSPGLIEELTRVTGEAPLGVVPNGVHLSDYFPEPDCEPDGVGGIHYEHAAKAPEAMLEIAERVRQRWPNTPVRLFGTDRRPACDDAIAYTRAPAVAQARRIYSSCRVWISTSRWEGFGLPVLEAMACGTPVVTTATDGSAGLVDDGVNGFAVPFGDWDHFVERIGEILEEPQRYRTMSANGVETARRFTWDKAVEQMEVCLEKLESQ
jgi:glycosyltransferase involved in cell wall biosynthesis